MDPLTLARLWLAIRPFKRLREHRAAKRAQAALSTASDHATVPSPEDAVLAMGGVTSPTLEEIETMNALKGALKSRLVWLGLAQIAYGLFNMWATGQAITPDSIGPLLTGAATVWLRALTTGTLASKVA